MASVDVQIGAADAARVDGNNNLFLNTNSGVRDVRIDHLLGPDVVQRFHRGFNALSKASFMLSRFDTNLIVMTIK